MAYSTKQKFLTRIARVADTSTRGEVALTLPRMGFEIQGLQYDPSRKTTIINKNKAVGVGDDVINVSGHRLGTMEIESALVSHEMVSEAAVVGRPDPLKGESIVAFVTLKTGAEDDETIDSQLKKHVTNEIGAIAKPDEIKFTDALPKTRSGKIMRRILRALASGDEISGDTSTLEDRSVLNRLRN